MLFSSIYALSNLGVLGYGMLFTHTHTRIPPFVFVDLSSFGCLEKDFGPWLRPVGMQKTQCEVFLLTIFEMLRVLLSFERSVQTTKNLDLCGPL